VVSVATPWSYGAIMPDVFDLASQYFWALALVFTAFNTFSYRQAMSRLMQKQPEQAERYAPWPYGFILLNGIIWLTMGFGMLVGGVPSLFSFFDPGAGNPYVITWHIVLVSIWVIAFLWIFVGQGARYIVDHPGMFFTAPGSINAVRLIGALSLLGGVVVELIMWGMHSRMPH